MTASQDAANKVIREHEVITLTAREPENFVNALLDPPSPNLALQKAAEIWKELASGKEKNP